MAFENKETYDGFRILTLLLIVLPFAASTNINCDGKSFYCVNSTHFMICVDLGGGVSSTIDGLVIPCPPTTECQATNRFECEFPSTTATDVVTRVSTAAEHLETTVSDSAITITPYQSRLLENNVVSTTRLQNIADKSIPVTLYAEILTTGSTKLFVDITLQPPLQKEDDTTKDNTEIFDLSKQFNVTSKKLTNIEAMITTATPVLEVDYISLPPIINLTKTDPLLPFVKLGEERVALDSSLNIDLLENSVNDLKLTAGTTYDTTETQISTLGYEVTTESAIMTTLTTKGHKSGEYVKTGVSLDNILNNMTSLGIVNDTKQDELITTTKENIKINITNFEAIEQSLYNELNSENLTATTSKATESIDMKVMQSTTSVNILQDDKTFSTTYTDTKNIPSIPSNYNPSETEIILENISTERNPKKENTTITIQNNVNHEILNSFSTESVNHIILENLITTKQSLGNEETTDRVAVPSSDTTDNTNLEKIYLTSTAESMSKADVTFFGEIDQNKFTVLLSNTEADSQSQPTTTAIEPIKINEVTTEMTTVTALQTKNISNGVEMIEAVTLNSVNKTLYTKFSSESVVTKQSLGNEETTESVAVTSLDTMDNTKLEKIYVTSTAESMSTADVTFFDEIDQNKFTVLLSNTEADSRSRPRTTAIEPITINEVTTEMSTVPALQTNNISKGVEMVEEVTSNSVNTTLYTKLSSESVVTKQSLGNEETTERVAVTSLDTTDNTKSEKIYLASTAESMAKADVTFFGEIDQNKFTVLLSNTEADSQSRPTTTAIEPIKINEVTTEMTTVSALQTNNISNGVEIIEAVTLNSVNTTLYTKFSSESVVTKQSLGKEETTESVAVTSLDTMDNTKLEKIYVTSTAESMSTADVTFFDEIDQHKLTVSLSNTEADSRSRSMTSATEPMKNNEVTTEMSTVTASQTNNISNGVEMVEAVTTNSVNTTQYTKYSLERTTQQDLQKEVSKEQVVRPTFDVEVTYKTGEIITTTYGIPIEQDTLRTSTLSNYEADRTLAPVTDPSLKNEVTTDISIVSTLQINNKINGEEMIKANNSETKPDTRFTIETIKVQQRLENAETTENLPYLKGTLNMEVGNILEDVDFTKDDTILSITNVMKGSIHPSTILPNTETKIKVENKVAPEKIASDRIESGRNVEVIDFIPLKSLSTQPENKVSATFSKLENASTIESLTTPMSINLKNSKYMENIIKSNAELETTTNGTVLKLNLKNESTSETNISELNLNTHISDTEEMLPLRNLDDVTIFEDIITKDAISTTKSTLSVLKTEQENNKKVFEPLISGYISTTENIISTTNEAKQHITTVVENMQLAADTISNKLDALEKNIISPTEILNTSKYNEFEVITNITSTPNNNTVHMALAALNITTQYGFEIVNISNIEESSMTQGTTESLGSYNNDNKEKMYTVGNKSTIELNTAILYDNNSPDNVSATGRSFIPKNITISGIYDKINLTLTESSTISSTAEIIPKLEGPSAVTINELALNTEKTIDYNIYDNAITEPTTFDTQITTESFLQEGTLKYAIAWGKKSDIDISVTKKDSINIDSTRDNVNGLTQTGPQDSINSDISNGVNKNLFDIIRTGIVTTKPSKQLEIQSPVSKIETAKMLTSIEKPLLIIEDDRNVYKENLALDKNLKTKTHETTMQLLKNNNMEQNLNISREIIKVMANKDEKYQTQNLGGIDRSYNISNQGSLENKNFIKNNSISNVKTMKNTHIDLHNSSNILKTNFSVFYSDLSKSQLVHKQASAQNTSDLNTDHNRVIYNSTCFQEKGDLNSTIKGETGTYEIKVVHQSMIRNDEIEDSRPNQPNSIIRDKHLNNVSNEIALQGQELRTLDTEKINVNIDNLEILTTQKNITSNSYDFKELIDTNLGTNVNIYERDTSVSLQQNNKVENDSMSIISSLKTNEAGNSVSSPKPDTLLHSIQITAEPNNKLRTDSEKEIKDTQVNETIRLASIRDLTNKSEDLITVFYKFIPNSQFFNNGQVNTSMSTKLTPENYNTTVYPNIVHIRQDMYSGILATNDSLTKSFEEGTLRKLEIISSPENLSTVKSEKEKAYFNEVAPIQLETAITGSQLPQKDPLLINESSVDIIKNGDMMAEYDLKNVTEGTLQLQSGFDLNEPQKMQRRDQFHKKSTLPLKSITQEMQNTTITNPLKGINEFTDEQIQFDKDFFNVLSKSDQKSISMTESTFNSFDSNTTTSVSLQGLKIDILEIETNEAKPISSDLLFLIGSTNKTQDMFVSLSKNVSGSNPKIDESRQSQATYDGISGLIKKALPEYATIYENNKKVIIENQNNFASTPVSVNKNNAERNKVIHLTEKYPGKLLVPSVITTTIEQSTSKFITNDVNKSNKETLTAQNKNPHMNAKFDANKQSQVSSVSHSEDTVRETNVKLNTTIEMKQKEKQYFSTSQNSSDGYIEKSYNNHSNSENSTNFYCRYKNRGKYSDREDCQKFYICIGRNEPIVGKCPQNTVFSEVRKQCTKNLSHCTRQSEFRCMAQGRFSDILEDNIYYICVSNGNHFIRFKFQCQNGFFLNKTSVKCYRQSESESNLQTSTKSIEYSSKSERSERREESMKDKYKSKEKKTRNDENKSVDFNFESEGKFAHPNDCRKYYVCRTNKKSEFRRKRKKCDSDEVFHKDKKECVDADSYEC